MKTLLILVLLAASLRAENIDLMPTQRQFTGKAKIAGKVDLRVGSRLTAPNLTRINGNLVLRSGAALNAPNLTNVTGRIVRDPGAVLNAPKLGRK